MPLFWVMDHTLIVPHGSYPYSTSWIIPLFYLMDHAQLSPTFLHVYLIIKSTNQIHLVIIKGLTVTLGLGSYMVWGWI